MSLWFAESGRLLTAAPRHGIVLQLKGRQMNGPDFSRIDSQAKVMELFGRGDLEKLFLLPLEFGGTERPENVVYVPVGIAEIKASTDANVIGKLAGEGKVTRYAATPRYSGKSFVPVAIDITASDPGTFVFNIAIWGEGIATPQS
jgi:hypothetical protein